MHTPALVDDLRGLAGSIWAGAFRRVAMRRCPACGQPSMPPICGTCCEASDLKQPGFRTAVRQIGDSTLEVAFLAAYTTRLHAAPTPLAELLLRFKYGGDRAAGHALLRLCRLYGRSLCDRVDLVVPIPLSSRRLKERGYNQAAWLARGLSRSICARMAPDALVRATDTSPQASRTARERRSLSGAFHAQGELVAATRVLLVDDVLTTGATLVDASRAIVAAGARSVAAATLLNVEHPNEHAPAPTSRRAERE